VPGVVRSLSAVAALPGVSGQIEAAREACTRLRWHQALRRRTPEAAAESRVRGAHASAALDGASTSVEIVRDVMRGAATWPEPLGPMEQVVRGAVQASAETEHVASIVGAAPLQAMARLHVAAAAGLVEQGQLGRPRRAGEGCAELVDLGPAPDAAVVAERLAGLAAVLLAGDRAPAVVVAAIAHAEIADLRPFPRGNGLVARALERAVVKSTGLDPTGVAVPEAGHRTAGEAAYLGALAAYRTGTPEGLALWVSHCCQAIIAGAAEGTRIADAVMAGRLS
jgi:Fic family protein